MVNKPHAPRSGGKGKKPAPAPSPVDAGEDTSFIVFGNDGDKKKKKKDTQPSQPAPSAAAAAAGGKGKANAPAAGENGQQGEPEQKKPDTRTLIGGASWTGKLPQTLLNEHAQKQRWERPDYVVHGNATKGFTGSVVLKRKEGKGGELVALPPFMPPKEYQTERGVQPTAIEARHFAASYALFRVNNMKNVHMMLPPRYRDLWKGDFADLLSEAKQTGKGWEYEADPFEARKRLEEEKVKREKARVEAGKRKEEDEKSKVVGLDGRVQGKHVLRGWLRVPKVEMGVSRRREVEGLIRAEGKWNPHEIKMPNSIKEGVVEHLASIGFRKSHAQEAAELCRDREECLEWLLIHVPEDDLPKWALPENYSAGVSMASSDLKREGKVKRLARGGYASEVCAEILDSKRGDESKAAELLQSRLLGDDEATFPDMEEGDDESKWDEELETLSAIYGERYTKLGKACEITLEVQMPSKSTLSLLARPPSSKYPNKVPVLAVHANLPAYIRLSILKQCLLHANENFLGEQMLFSIVDWLEREIPRIVEHPGRLSEIASAASTSAEETPGQASRPSRAQRQRRTAKAITWASSTPASRDILSAWQSKQGSSQQQRMLQSRRNLPAWKLQDAILGSVTANQVTIISGETGSGKSTQSVQFILDDLISRNLGEHANIICTQPRRISALGLADRVAEERCGKVGDEVGYVIRGESRMKAGVTKLSFVTTGVLLRRLQTSGGSTKDVVDSLADVSHVVIDEVHERSLDTDFLLILMRDVLRKRKDLKLVLMSATLDAAVFEQYFASAGASVGKVEIEGRTHPVTDIYLDEIVMATGFGGMRMEDDAEDADSRVDSMMEGSGEKIDSKALGSRLRAVGTRINYNLIARTVQFIDNDLGSVDDGGVLIFLPGVAEIDQTLRALRDIPHLHAMPLHAAMQSADQRRVFQPPPRGLRKVVVATNVAETSITIDDIVAVIDTGRVKETSFDPTDNMVKLAEVWASRAACKQRRGRAGRVKPGVCYKMYTRSAEMDKMAERPEPEIRRVPLEQLCLSVKAMGVADAPAFLAQALTPPATLAVDTAMKMLRRIGALEGDVTTELTSLGRHLAMIPADLRCGKLLVYGAAFGCLEACLTVAAILTVKSPFVNPQAKRDEAKAARKAFGDGQQGDLICDLQAYREWSERRDFKREPTSVLRRWCDDNFLSHQTLLDISMNRRQYLASLQEIGFLSPSANSASFDPVDSMNKHNHNIALLRALIAGAFQPQIARIEFPDKKFTASAAGAVEQDPDARTIKYFNEENGRVFVHPSSTLFDAQTFPGNACFVAYFSKMATSKTFVRELTPFNVFSVLMFGGPIEVDVQGRGLLVDGWIRLRGWARIGVLVSRLRGMFDEVLGRKIDEPGLDVGEMGVARVVRKLVELDGLDR